MLMTPLEKNRISIKRSVISECYIIFLITLSSCCRHYCHDAITAFISPFHYAAAMLSYIFAMIRRRHAMAMIIASRHSFDAAATAMPMLLPMPRHVF